MRRIVHALTVAVSAGFGASTALAQGTPVSIVTDSMVSPFGEIVPSKGIVLRGASIESLGPAPTTTETRVDAYPPGSVASPGLINAYTVLGQRSQRPERRSRIEPDLAAGDAVDFADPFFAAQMREGVTACVTALPPGPIVGGVAGVFRTWTETADRPSVVRAEGALVMGLGPSVLDLAAGPTSRVGAMALLRDAIADAGERKDGRLYQATTGKMDILGVCDSTEDVVGLIGLGLGPRLSLVHRSSLVEVAPELGGSVACVITGPFGPGDSRRVLEGPAAASAAGLDVAFGSGSALDPQALRMSAALAVASGLSPEAARRGLTIMGAKSAGVSERLGSLAAGKDADIVVFSGDPLRPDSRVLGVYILGKLVYSGAGERASPETVPADDVVHGGEP